MRRRAADQDRGCLVVPSRNRGARISVVDSDSDSDGGGGSGVSSHRFTPKPLRVSSATVRATSSLWRAVFAFPLLYVLMGLGVLMSSTGKTWVRFMIWGCAALIWVASGMCERGVMGPTFERKVE